MQTLDKKRLLVLSSCLLLAVGVAGAVMARRQTQTVKVPKVISKVKNLEVVGVSLLREGEDSAALAIEIHNTSEKPVVAVSVESGNDKDAAGVDINGDIDDDQPKTIIEPYGTKTVELPVSDLLPGKPVKVAAAVFADGTEDGEAVALSSMREHRRRDKAETLKRKGGSKQ